MLSSRKSERPETEDEWVNRHAINFLYLNAAPAIVGSFAVVVLIGFSVADFIDYLTLYIWLGTGIFLAVCRFLTLVLFRLKSNKFEIPFWKNSYRLLNCLSGALIGIGTSLFFPEIPSTYQVMLLAAVVGLSAAALATHSVDFQAFCLFMLPACITPAVTFMLSEIDGQYIYSILLGLFTMVMIKAGIQTRATLLENFRLTYTLHYRATHDSLVGLLNREEFERRFLFTVPNSRHHIALIFIDLDNFKDLNDTFGHHKGDQALTEFAEVISSNTRKDDISARLGGDEFTILLLVEHIHAAKAVANSIITATKDMKINAAIGKCKIGCSIGLAYTENNQIDYSALMRYADKECYKSKQNGKNQMNFIELDQAI